jgi:hypothetical protein
VVQRDVGKRCHMLRFLEFEGRRVRVSYVTVSGVWREWGKGVTCYSFWVWWEGVKGI